MWTYVVAIVVLLVSLFTCLGIFIDILNSQGRTATRGFFWIGIIISLGLLIVGLVAEMTKLSNG